ncbi:SGNH/GDSL hydrolase family protein [Candidatus Uabimicrobium amorphum]|uniref:SGNH hydrolase-type esterase domain-containing protein n=1 Tax=Uabimicrobium amorphum TaxID=2596890 RepID=A0A5S9IVP3_UABAM|nr:hypothetical protein [Candidatus Uabimicrobium amorphum]BBM87405.1 hypothetical protein UABAM_05814 [Candidatus Uabimicrobium amorphum]
MNKKFINAIKTSRISKILLLKVSLISVFLFSELVLRILGYLPFQAIDNLDTPVMFEYDHYLGWRNKKGNYTFQLHGDNINTTILHNRTRVTGEKQGDLQKKIICIGGSYTQGWAISDNETYPWKIQKKFRNFDVLNYGTSGYGTYQSLLLLKNIIPKTKSPKIVIYGFIDHHEQRNIARQDWLLLLSNLSKRNHIYTPYVSLAKNKKLAFHPPEKYPKWPFSHYSSFISMVNRKYVYIKTMSRRHQRKITKELLSLMNKYCDRSNIILLIAILKANDDMKKQYISFFKKNDIYYVDCVFPFTADMVVKGDGHPNGKLNTLWAQKLSRALQEFVNKN